MPGPPVIVKINAARLLAELQHLARLTDCPPTTDASLPAPTQAVTRIVFTPRDLEARAWLTGLAEAAGFTVRVDAVGNTFLRWPGSDPALPAVGTGSHTDAIPHAGMYDGTVGVLGGLEAMRSLKESGFTPRRSIETVMFTSEEPTRFGIGCLGSRLMAGVLNPQTADALPDRLSETDSTTKTGAPSGIPGGRSLPAGVASVPLHGTGGIQGAPSSPAASSQARVGELPATLAQARTAAGFTGSLSTVQLPTGYFNAWVELHIEQGPLLERAMSAARDSALKGTGFSPSIQSPSATGALAPEGAEQTILGLVTHIAAPASYRYTIQGIGGHAGALLMPDRRDALCAASDLILSVERHTLEANKISSGVDSVATVGTVAVHPGAVNSVPSRVTLMLDIRDTDVARRGRILAALHADIAEIQSRRGVTITEELINADLPATSDPRILAALEAACEQVGATHIPMVSRAYHDSTFMARLAPIAMLFVPCRNGVSHRPDEYATPEAIAQGTHVLALTLAALASE